MAFPVPPPNAPVTPPSEIVGNLFVRPSLSQAIPECMPETVHRLLNALLPDPFVEGIGCYRAI